MNLIGLVLFCFGIFLFSVSLVSSTHGYFDEKTPVSKEAIQTIFLLFGLITAFWGLGGWSLTIPTALMIKEDVFSKYDTLVKTWYIPYFTYYFFIGGLVSFIPHLNKLHKLLKASKQTGPTVLR